MIHEKFIIIEGIDGCGKGTVLNAIIDFLGKSKVKFLDLREKEADLTGNLPKGIQAIITCEPTHHGAGKELKEKILKNLSSYTAKQVAEKFAEDRNELYKKVIIPASEKGLLVIQDRSFISSFVYQLNQARANNEKFSEKDLEVMNKKALDNPPGLVIVQKVKPDIAFERLSGRKDKQDGTDFEKINFLRQNSAGYSAKWWRDLLESKGTEIIELDCNEEIGRVMQNAVNVIKGYCSKNNLLSV